LLLFVRGTRGEKECDAREVSSRHGNPAASRTSLSLSSPLGNRADPLSAPERELLAPIFGFPLSMLLSQYAKAC